METPVGSYQYEFAKEETRDLAAASGAVAYTGYGFKPSRLIIFACVQGSVLASWGFACKAAILHDSHCIHHAYDGNYYNSQVRVVSILTAAGVYQDAYLNSFDDDGFSLYWAKVGLPTGTIRLEVFVIR